MDTYVNIWYGHQIVCVDTHLGVPICMDTYLNFCIDIFVNIRY